MSSQDPNTATTRRAVAPEQQQMPSSAPAPAQESPSTDGRVQDEPPPPPPPPPPRLQFNPHDVIRLPPANITIVRTAREFKEALQEEALDIEIQAHLDLRSLTLTQTPLAVGQTGCNEDYGLVGGPCTHSLYVDRTRSIRGNCQGPPTSTQAAAFALPQAVVQGMTAVAPRQCVLVVNKPALQTISSNKWFDNLHFAIARESFTPTLSIVQVAQKSRTGAGSNLFFTKVTFQADKLRSLPSTAFDILDYFNTAPGLRGIDILKHAVLFEDCKFHGFEGIDSPLIVTSESFATFRRCNFTDMALTVEVFDVSFGGRVRLEDCTFRNVLHPGQKLLGTSISDDFPCPAETPERAERLSLPDDDNMYDFHWVPLDPARPLAAQYVANETLSDCLFRLYRCEINSEGAPSVESLSPADLARLTAPGCPSQSVLYRRSLFLDRCRTDDVAGPSGGHAQRRPGRAFTSPILDRDYYTDEYDENEQPSAGGPEDVRGAPAPVDVSIDQRMAPGAAPGALPPPGLQDPEEQACFEYEEYHGLEPGPGEGIGAGGLWSGRVGFVHAFLEDTHPWLMTMQEILPEHSREGAAWAWPQTPPTTDAADDGGMLDGLSMHALLGIIISVTVVAIAGIVAVLLALRKRLQAREHRSASENEAVLAWMESAERSSRRSSRAASSKSKRSSSKSRKTKRSSSRGVKRSTPDLWFYNPTATSDGTFDATNLVLGSQDCSGIPPSAMNEDFEYRLTRHLSLLPPTHDPGAPQGVPAWLLQLPGGGGTAGPGPGGLGELGPITSLVQHTTATFTGSGMGSGMSRMSGMSVASHQTHSRACDTRSEIQRKYAQRVRGRAHCTHTQSSSRAMAGVPMPQADGGGQGEAPRQAAEEAADPAEWPGSPGETVFESAMSNDSGGVGTAADAAAAAVVRTAEVQVAPPTPSTPPLPVAHVHAEAALESRGISVKATDAQYTSYALARLVKQLDRFKGADRFLGEYEVLGRGQQRRGGQAVVQFLRRARDSREFAVKFFLDTKAFYTETALFAAYFPHLRASLRHLPRRPPPSIAEDPSAAAAADTDPDGDASGAWEAVPGGCQIPGARFLPHVEAVCDSLDAGLADPRGMPLPPCIVMERGESLLEWSERAEPDRYTCLAVLTNLAQRMADMHAAGCCHRDLKPANVMWLPRENRWTVIDFGCAARIGNLAPVSFTLTYAAPEVVKAYITNEKQLMATAAMDVWSLGVMAFELLTRAPAFDLVSEGSIDVVEQLMGDIPLAWEAGGPKEGALKKLGPLREPILQMLQRDPRQRLTMAAFYSFLSNEE